MTKPNIVEVTRFLRLKHADGKTRGNGGVTLKFVIHHAEQMLEIFPAVCVIEDTFTKEAGWQLTETRKILKTGIVTRYFPECSLIDNFTAIFDRIDEYESAHGTFNWKRSTIKYIVNEWTEGEKHSDLFDYIQPKGERKQIKRLMKEIIKLLKQDVVLRQKEAGK